jgi:membrane protein required for colicin V production
MILDFLIVLPIIFGALIGFRDGAVRKLVSIAMTIGAMFVAHYFTQDLASALVTNFNTDPGWAPINAFLILFLSIITLQSILYRLLTGNYKIGGFADRVAGAALGLLHMGLVISIILMMLSIQGIPSRGATKESRSYQPILNIAPRMVDMLATQLPEVKDALERLKRPDTPIREQGTGLQEKVQELIDQSVEEQTERQMKQIQAPADTLRKR